MARPRKYTEEEIEKIRRSFKEYVEINDCPIISIFCRDNGIERHTLYDYSGFSEFVKIANSKTGRSGVKKYDYEYTGASSAIKAKYKQNTTFRLRVCMAARISDALRRCNSSNTGNKILRGLDYTIDELKAYLEGLFEPGMSWENYGKWHIDHIRPVASFVYEDEYSEEFKKCWVLENLQPLWASDNIRKGCTFIAS